MQIGSSTRSAPRSWTDHRRPSAVPALGVLVALGLAVGAGLVLGLVPGGVAPSPSHRPVLAAPVPAVQIGPSSGSSYGSGPSCDGMYWSSSYWVSYDPSYCYGHDEPTMSYLSNAPGSGANASWSMLLPSDSASYAQGDFYATIWFGGSVYDTASVYGGNQAFLELQFYPAAPAATGAGSGKSDCFPNGAFNPSFAPGGNKWFACAVVWQLASVGGSAVEDAAFAGPIDVGGTTGILQMHSNDRIFVNFTGSAQSSTQGWNINVSDATAHASGATVLKNGSLVLSPYYSTAASGNTLHWAASNAGAIAFAYEIGHAYTLSSCSPGDTYCDSYYPVRWSHSGQIDLGLPKVGSPASATYPSRIVLSSSQGGEYEVNSSSCRAPSTSASKNCLYPYYVYRSGSYGFDFGTGNLTNVTHDYGSLDQFPATLNGGGQWNGNSLPAPWGTVRFTIYPSNASATFSEAGTTTALALAANRTATDQFVEGRYYLNVSAPGCSRSMTSLYVSPGGLYNDSVILPCGPGSLSSNLSASPTSGTFPLTVSFNATATGGAAPYNFSWQFGDTPAGFGQAFGAHVSHVYASPGVFSATVLVVDGGGNGSLSSITVSVHEPSCSGANRTVALGVVQYCHLNSGQHATFRFVVSKADWFQQGWIDVYVVNGATTGGPPVFKTGVGMPGTPGLTAAKQKANGPSAHVQVILDIQAANKYHGWGTYWAYVTAVNGSGGFCFVAANGNGSFSSPPNCPSAVNGPRSGGSGPSSGSSGSGSAPTSGSVRPPASPSASAPGVRSPGGLGHPGAFLGLVGRVSARPSLG